MSIARAAAEIEPEADISSSSAILPGPIRPSGSRFIRRLSEGILVARSRSEALIDKAIRQVFVIERHRFYHCKDLLADMQPKRIEGQASDPRQHLLFLAIDVNLDQRIAPVGNPRDLPAQ